MLRELHPLTWEFHQNTSRWFHNVQDLPDQNFVENHFKEYLQSPTFNLPKAEYPEIALSKLIHNRYSCRKFKKESINLKSLATVLSGGYGITDYSVLDNSEFFDRAVPSGGGLYPLELYIIARAIENLPNGVYHYSVQHNILEQINDLSLTDLMISNLFMNQPYVANASAIVIISTCFERNMIKYGDRGYRYIMYEAGHCMQNLNLVSLSLNLGSLNLGGFFDYDLADLLNIDIENELPLYCMALGVPNGKNKTNLRAPSK